MHALSLVPTSARLEMHVEGRPLRELLGAPDLVSPFGWLLAEAERQHARELLGLAPSPLPSGRPSLLVCPECADAGCGVVTATLERREGRVRWSGFRIETDRTERVEDDGPRPLPGAAPFLEFDEAAYDALLRPLAQLP